MSAEILEFSSILRPQVPSAIEEARLDSFCKAPLILKLFLKSSGIEIVCGVQNLLAAELITPDEARALGQFYGWEMWK
jgi:hypothetical protein